MAQVQEVTVPDIGDTEAVDVIEILVGPGDSVALEDPLITLESDKASMDIPAPAAGTIKELKVKTGDQVSQGSLILLMEVEPAAEAAPKKEAEDAPPAEQPTPEPPSQPEPPSEEATAAPPPSPAVAPSAGQSFAKAYASPSVRRLARQLGADLAKMEGSGRNGRIVRGDVEGFVKQALAADGSAAGGGPLPAMPKIDFAQFGEIETVPMSRIQKISSASLHRSWLHVPHVTQHDEADITEMDSFRRSHSDSAKARGFNLTPVAFVVKAAVAALQKHPRLNASLAPDGEAVILKKYFHIGIAVDTEEGLVVPVIRDADRKSLFEIAQELGDLSQRARQRKLKIDDLRGASFSITSLGGIGGTAFTPIVNAPEVAILGLSRAAMQPRWQGEIFEPRLILPLSLSYDHRVVDGALAARFTTTLSWVLGDLRRLLL